MERNTFIVSNSVMSGQGWIDLPSSELNIAGNVNNNHFEASGSGISTATRAGVGWWFRGGVNTIDGNVNSNTFVASDNTTNGFDLWVSDNGIMTIGGNIKYNKFISVGNQTNGRGFCFTNVSNADPSSVGGDVSSNQFTITDNEVSNKALDIIQSLSIGGSVSDNLINIIDTIGVLNAGIAVTISTDEEVVFNKVVQGNQINITTTSDNTNDSFDIDLSATSGSDGIIFEKNSATGTRSLTNLNNGASVDIDATNNNVIFNG